MAVAGAKRRLPLVALADIYLMVRFTQVEFSKNFRANYAIERLLN